MQQHPIPQNVTQYQFRLVGDMTLKQFLELAGGLVLAYLFFASNLIFIVKWPLVILSMLFGAGLAFFPIEDRPLDQWITNFIKAIYQPTRFTWQKTNKIPHLFLFTPHAPEVVNTITKTIKAPNIQNPAKQSSDLSDQEASLVHSLDDLFTSLPQPSNPEIVISPQVEDIEKPSVVIRKLSPVESLSEVVLNTPKTESVSISKSSGPQSELPQPAPQTVIFTAPSATQTTSASLQHKKTAAFKKKYRAPNVLLIDDIQFIAGKEYTQEEFFHTFNELYMSERQIVLTSDRPPQEIPKIEERLSSRFMGGLMVDIQSPDFETRVAILTQKCNALKLTIPSEAISLIAERTTTNIRELEGALQGILTKALPYGGDITSDIVREYFGAEHERRSQRIRPNSVINKTAQYFSFKPSELTGSSRKAPLTNARHTAMYLLYKDLQLPYEQVGRLFGGRDHTTIIHAVEKIEEKIKTDPDMAKIIADIKHDL